MTPKNNMKNSLKSIYHWLIVGTGLIAWGGTTALTIRIVWESTFLSWERGPQNIGFSLIHGEYIFLLIFPIILLVWLFVVIIDTIIALIRRKQITLKRWVSIVLTIFVLAILIQPYDFWQRLFANQIAQSQHAVAFINSAARRGDIATVKEILNHGDFVNASNPWDGDTPLHAAATGGHIVVVKYLITEGFEVNAINRSGKSPLENALSWGKEEVAEFLTNHGGERIQGEGISIDSIFRQTKGESFE